MGCGCKNETKIPFIGDTEKIQKKLTKSLEKNGKFSFLGLILFIIVAPISALIIIPFVTIILFNRLILRRDTDLTKLLVYTKDKKNKK